MEKKFGFTWNFLWMYEDDDEDEEGRRWRNVKKKLDVGDAALDTIDLHNLAVPFLKKDQRAEISKFIRSMVDHLQCWST